MDTELDPPVTITTAPCMLCHANTLVELTGDEYDALKNGAYIQHALATRDAPFRELVMSGTHPECWETMFPEEDE